MRHPRARTLALALVVVVVTAWSLPARAQCAKDTDCKGARVCVDGRCQDPSPAGCRADVDCPGQKVCEQGRCVSGGAPAAGDEPEPRATARDQDVPEFDPHKVPAVCQGPGYRVASLPGTRKIRSVQPAEVCRLAVDGAADTTLSLVRSPAVPSLDQAVLALSQGLAEAAQRADAQFDVGTLEGELSGAPARGVVVTGQTDARRGPRAVFLYMATVGPATYLITVDGPLPAVDAMYQWFELFGGCVTLDPHAPAPPAPKVARPVLQIPTRFEARRVEELGLQWELFADSQVEDRSQEGRTQLAFVHPALPGVSFEVAYTLAAFAPAKVAAETLKSLKQDLAAQGATFKSRATSRKVAGRAAHGFVIDKLSLPQQELAYRETLIVNHGDLLFIATVVGPDRDAGVAHRALGALLDRVRFFAPVVNHDAILKGRMEYLGERADHELLIFDGKGGVERYFAAASHMMPNGSFFQSSGSSTHGTYKVRGRQVVLDVGSLQRTCDIRFRDNGSVLKLDCGGFWYNWP